MEARTITTDPAALLADQLTGDVITPDHPDYDESRRLWNGMIERRPALVVRPRDAGDVAACVAFARD